jgi:hypothetical protein
MKKIVIMSSNRGADEAFIRLVETLFPECEVCVVLPDQDAPVVSGKECEVMTGKFLHSGFRERCVEETTHSGMRAPAR